MEGMLEALPAVVLMESTAPTSGLAVRIVEISEPGRRKRINGRTALRAQPTTWQQLSRISECVELSIHCSREP